jgi:hypothetical protein
MFSGERTARAVASGAARQMDDCSIEFTDLTETHYGGPRSDNAISERYPDKSHSESKQALADLKALFTTHTASVKEDVSSHQRKGIHHFDGGVDTVTVQQIIAAFGGSAVLIAVLKAAKDVIIKLLSNRESRSIKIKNGKHEITLTGSSVTQFDKAVEALEKMQADAHPAEAAAPAPATKRSRAKTPGGKANP